jgi:arginine decarboxylase
MQIHIGSGIGVGPTKMAAFDAALNDIGIANYNMLALSSIIPPKSEVVTHRGRMPFDMPGTWGDRMYVVMAEMRVDTPNKEAWAGIGWVQDKETGRGLFTEHTGANEETVRRDIQQTLEALMATRNINWGEVQMQVIGRTCTHQPICALVAALFQVSDWDNKAYLVEGKPQNGETKGRFWNLSRPKS